MSMASMPTRNQTPSITQTMSRMALRMEAILEAQHRDNPALQEGEVRDELRFWIAVDPVLAHLHKQLQDAKRAQQMVVLRHGTGDVMSDVAADMKDSAETAFETRLLELKAQEDKQRTVDAMMKAAIEEEEREKTEAVQARSRAFWREFARPKGTSAAGTKGTQQYWYILFGLMVLQSLVSHTARELSAAYEFGRAAKKGLLSHAFAVGS
jgi:hypothetical protein